ncbi:MAG TPA: arylamine N-acetyltransferase [Streptosporangiaceae bacterium]|jgi:N-hydroxyarylamine O-acetyltransferase|nr:arylamine N-acetyltransferase [Streptosporangiaceae bacterium]
MDDQVLAAYLSRIEVTGPVAADQRTLRELHQAHQRTVPFENLSIFLGEAISLTDADLIDKIVTRRRGGFCYELNGAFALLLEAIGFTVSRVAARVYGKDGLGPPFDHLALIVTTAEGSGESRPLHPPPTTRAGTADGNGPWLADVGFGSHSDYPLLLDERGEQPDPAGTFQLDGAQHGDIEVAKDGQPQYRIERRPRDLAEFVPACWWQQTWPQSHFREGTICSLLAPDGRISLAAGLLIRTSGGSRTEEQLPTDEAVLAAYRDQFGVELTRVPPPTPPSAPTA